MVVASEAVREWGSAPKITETKAAAKAAASARERVESHAHGGKMQRFRSEACGRRGGGAWVQAPTLLRDCEQMASEDCAGAVRNKDKEFKNS